MFGQTPPTCCRTLCHVPLCTLCAPPPPRRPHALTVPPPLPPHARPPPSAPGTIVSSLEKDRERFQVQHRDLDVSVKGFATIDNVCLINIEGTGMVGVPGEWGWGRGRWEFRSGGLVRVQHLLPSQSLNASRIECLANPLNASTQTHVSQTQWPHTSCRPPPGPR